MCARIADVLAQVVGEVLLGEPVRLPVVDVPHAHGLGMDLLSHVSSLLLGRERDREVAGALADRRRATHGARAEALERRTLVGGDRVDAQLVADQLVVVLGVGDGRLEQLLPVLARRARGVCARIARASVDGLAADVVADQARLAGGRADVLGLGADDRALARACASACASALRLLGGLGVGGLLARAALGAGFSSALGGGLGSALGGLGAASRGLGLGVVSSACSAAAARPSTVGGLLGGLVLASGFVVFFGSATASGPSRCRRGRGRCGSARTRRACGRPSTRCTKTGTCLRPSCTAIVWPTISGKIVEVRDQVLTICLRVRRVHRVDARP